ncbi:hypothetical protein J21TS3_19410 [Paenibacillus cookii]|uniref:Uncharacterized protein n=1 Tax=Paenibacillus cookii TaxID=157839 RepID=A0ABQ4LV19_9BACL|nr:hypothetical protein J21TS3_19410 [Paenibacillus cookii]
MVDPQGRISQRMFDACSKLRELSFPVRVVWDEVKGMVRHHILLGSWLLSLETSLPAESFEFFQIFASA